jgi:hypothetical protein
MVRRVIVLRGYTYSPPVARRRRDRSSACYGVSNEACSGSVGPHFAECLWSSPMKIVLFALSLASCAVHAVELRAQVADGDAASVGEASPSS